MMTDREDAGSRNDTKQTRFLEVDATILGTETSEHCDAGLNFAGRFHQKFCKRNIALGCIKGETPKVVGQHRIAMHTCQIEEDIDRK